MDESLKHKRALIAIITILVLLVGVTFAAGWLTQGVVRARVERLFGLQADQIASTYNHSMITNILMLQGLRAYWNSVGRFDYHNFSTYVDSLSTNLQDKTGFSSFFYIKAVQNIQVGSMIKSIKREPNIPEIYQTYKITPPSNNELVYPLVYVTPLSGRENVLGLDFASKPDRYEAVLYARDHNALATTMSLTLQTTGDPGFLMMLPLYTPNTQIERLADRRANFAGIVAISLRSDEAFDEIFGKDDPYPYLDFQIYQGEATTSDRLLYDHDPSFDQTQSNLTTKRVVRLYDQTWTIMVSMKPNFRLGEAEERLPFIVFLVGMLMSIGVGSYFLIQYGKHMQQHLART